MIRSGALFAGVAANAAEEEFTPLAEHAGARVERIVSTGHASPAGFWYDQHWTEWVIVLQGEAALAIEGEPHPRILAPGDWLELLAHVRHRVEWTRADPPTVWLAIHWSAPAPGR